ncbi:MAG: type I methionyl aminopeptidase [Sphaerochaetaceae bacterium]|jgi:methionyl aminopeptidase
MIQLKTKDEIEAIHDSGRILSDLLDSLAGFIEAGMSTWEVDRYCHDFIVKRHGKPACLGYMGFPGSACVSVNNEVIHGIPKKSRIISDGDVVKVDLDCNLKGFISDSARTYLIGNVSDEARRLEEVTRQCFFKGLEKAIVGNRIHDISLAVFNHATRAGFGVMRDYCGHGVGFELHEDPNVPNFVNPMEGNPRLRSGLVICIEPMIHLGTARIRTLNDGWTVVTADSKIGAHYEHTVAVTDDGPRILTIND